MRFLRTCRHRKHRPGAQRRWANAPSAVRAAVLSACVLCAAVPAVAVAKPISKPRWVEKVQLTEYWPVPEAWFDGALVTAPGLDGKHRVDWLYSARGLSMEGDGIALDGSKVHIDSVGSSGWVQADGKSGNPPFWRGENLWRNRKGAVTYPLLSGGWYHGKPKKFIANHGITFAKGASRALSYYRSIAVDPGLVPLGSRVYVPAYKKAADGGWMCAADTGGYIKGRHIDIYRPAPEEKFGGGYSLSGEPIYVVPPGKSLPKGAPKLGVDPCVDPSR